MGIRQISQTIHTCDRCGNDGEVGIAGAFKDGHAELRYENVRETSGSTSFLQLCGECRDAFEKFLHEKGRAADPAEMKDDCG